MDVKVFLGDNHDQEVLFKVTRQDKLKFTGPDDSKARSCCTCGDRELP